MIKTIKPLLLLIILSYTGVAFAQYDSNFLLSVLFKVQELRDKAIAEIKKIDTEIKKNEETIQESQQIISLASQRTDANAIKAEKIARDALMKAQEAKRTNEETRKQWEFQKIRADKSYATIQNMLSQKYDSKQQIKGFMTNYTGNVYIIKANGEKTSPDNGFLEPGDKVWTGNGTAEIQMLDGRANAKLGPYSEFEIQKDTPQEQVAELLKGKVYMVVDKIDDYAEKMNEKINQYKEDIQTISQLNEKDINDLKNYIINEERKRQCLLCNRACHVGSNGEINCHIKLSHFNKGLKGRLFAKMESRNPAFSIKDRIAYSMIKDAVERGILKEGMTIIEPTSGNTGIALAMVGASMGFNVLIAMPESMSIERRLMMQMLGAQLILTPAEKGMKGAIDKVNEMAKENPDKFFIPGQFDNPANPKIHEGTTGPEIYRDLNGDIDVFVAGVGTGGTITGVSRFLKRVLPHPFIAVAVEPAASPAITKHLNNESFTPAPHKIQGIGAGFIPKNLDLSVVDRVETVGNDEAIDFSKEMFKREGIISGISSGANFAAAYRLAQSDEFEGKNIVFVVCDTGERYLSTDLFK